MEIQRGENKQSTDEKKFKHVGDAKLKAVAKALDPQNKMDLRTKAGKAKFEKFQADMYS